MSRKKGKVGLGKHTNIPEGLVAPLEDLARHEFVKRTILGRFNPRRHRYPKGHLRYVSDTHTGVKVNGYHPRGIQEVYVVVDPVSERASVIEYLAETYRT